MYTDYSGVDVKEVVRRGIGRVRPADDKGEELRDVVLWLIVLQYAKQSKAGIAFISGDKTFQHTDGSLHPTLNSDLKKAAVTLLFYRTIGDFIKGNSLESEPLEQAAIVAFVSDQEVRGLATEQLLHLRLWIGTIVGAEVSKCNLAEARRYRVSDDSYYVEARYTGEGTIRIVPSPTISAVVNPSMVTGGSTKINTNVPIRPIASYLVEGSADLYMLRQIAGESASFALTGNIKTYRCNFSIRLSLRVVGDKRESLEVDEFILLGELTPMTTGS